jgi:hypothetical protein
MDQMRLKTISQKTDTLDRRGPDHFLTNSWLDPETSAPKGTIGFTLPEFPRNFIGRQDLRTASRQGELRQKFCYRQG